MTRYRNANCLVAIVMVICVASQISLSVERTEVLSTIASMGMVIGYNPSIKQRLHARDRVAHHGPLRYLPSLVLI